MVEALYIAAVQDKQMAVAAYMEAQLLAGTLTLLAYSDTSICVRATLPTLL